MGININRNFPSGWTYAIHAAHNNECALCARVSEHIGHIVPWSVVKEHKLSNLVPMCSTCNLGISDLAWRPRILKVLLDLAESKRDEINSLIRIHKEFTLPDGKILKLEIKHSKNWKITDAYVLVREFLKLGKESIEKLAKLFGKTICAIRAKLVTLGVYQYV